MQSRLKVTHMPESANFHEQAREAEARGDWLDSYRIRMEAAALKGSQNPAESFQLAQAAAYAGLFKEALDTIERIDPKSVRESNVFMLRADIAERMGQQEQAIEWRSKALPLMADPYWALFGLARSKARLSPDLTESCDLMEQALSLSGAEKKGARFAATLYLKQRDWRKADAVLERFGLDAEERDRIVLSSLPGMTSIDERWCLRRIVKEKYRGLGDILDLGCWLGSLTASLASGARQNARFDARGRKIHAYDLFTWKDDWYRGLWDRIGGLGTPPQEGESFVQVFQQVTSAWSDLIAIHAGDLTKEKWTGGPIEILSVDAMKTVPVARHILLEHYACLVQGAHVFHQDFCHDFTWWIHIHQYLLRDHFSVVDLLPKSGGVLFVLDRPIPAKTLRETADANLSQPGLAADAFAHSLGLVANEDRNVVAAAYARCEMMNGREANALAIREKYGINIPAR